MGCAWYCSCKKHRNDMTLLGNQLDKLMRALNYDQTNGILVGNAVSRIISEIILCSVDEQISKKFPEISCCRFVDDYYIYVSKSSQIQEIISYIRTCLAQYELSFNENKIRITEGPFCMAIHGLKRLSSIYISSLICFLQN